MDRPGRIYENIVEVHADGWDVRVWFARGKHGPSAAEDYVRLQAYVDLLEWSTATDPFVQVQRIADNLANVNAVEVRRGWVGSLAYNDWP